MNFKTDTNRRAARSCSAFLCKTKAVTLFCWLLSIAFGAIFHLSGELFHRCKKNAVISKNFLGKPRFFFEKSIEIHCDL